jgi:hypothetical protein
MEVVGEGMAVETTELYNICSGDPVAGGKRSQSWHTTTHCREREPRVAPGTNHPSWTPPDSKYTTTFSSNTDMYNTETDTHTHQHTHTHTHTNTHTPTHTHTHTHKVIIKGEGKQTD